MLHSCSEMGIFWMQWCFNTRCFVFLKLLRNLNWATHPVNEMHCTIDWIGTKMAMGSLGKLSFLAETVHNLYCFLVVKTPFATAFLSTFIGNSILIGV